MLSMLLLAVLFILASSVAGFTKFSDSYIITSADIGPGQILTVTDVPSDYKAYFVPAKSTTNFDYLKNVFLLESDDYYGVNNLYYLHNEENGPEGQLSSYHLAILTVNGTIRIHDRNNGSTKADPYVIYVVDDEINYCKVFSVVDLEAKPYTTTSWGGCPSSAMILSAEPIFTLHNFITPTGELYVYTAPTEAVRDERRVFFSQSKGISAASTVVIAGPMATVDMGHGTGLSFNVSLDMPYKAPFAPETAIGLSSFGYCDVTKSYNHPYPSSVVPESQRFPIKATVALEVTVHGRSDAAGVALELDFINGPTKQYDRTFDEHFTAGANGVEIRTKSNATRYFVQVTAL